jgi:hypothetical protein
MYKGLGPTIYTLVRIIGDPRLTHNCFDELRWWQVLMFGHVVMDHRRRGVPNLIHSFHLIAATVTDACII